MSIAGIFLSGMLPADSPRVIATMRAFEDRLWVKTAIGGEDANWGRVVMAVGKAGEPADRDRLSVWCGGLRVAHKGARDPAYDEAAVSAAMKQSEITLKVALGLGMAAGETMPGRVERQRSASGRDRQADGFAGAPTQDHRPAADGGGRGVGRARRRNRG